MEYPKIPAKLVNAAIPHEVSIRMRVFSDGSRAFEISRHGKQYGIANTVSGALMRVRWAARDARCQ